MKQVTLLAGSKETSNMLEKQLRSFLPAEVELHAHSVDASDLDLIYGDLIIYSSETLYEEVATKYGINHSIPYIVGNRTINYDALEEVVSIPVNAKVLLVNDLYESAYEVAQALKDIGLSHMALTLYYPGCTVKYDNVDYVITPGELDCVPKTLTNIIDIGSRIFDFKTIAGILSKLNCLETSSASFSKMYLEKIINVARKLAESRQEVLNLNHSLDRVIAGFDKGLLIFNAEKEIVLFNEALKKMLKISDFQSIEGPLRKAIRNRKLYEYLLDSRQNQDFTFMIDGNEYAVSKFKMNQSALICATFKSMQDHHQALAKRRESVRKGYVAKYNLTDIVGISENVVLLKDLIKKLARTDMSILIHGESGTGKELAASAIHNESHRSEGPFLAVNFSALSDELIESELFGYEEGAFTGAKKGGKKGLFEEADGGTLFLDEIGDISLKVQSRLLRVLEEKEVMRVGGNAIIPVDVRVIAATNKDLLGLVEEKKFRDDLYYRLKMGYLFIEPLRQRIIDIPILLETMVESATMAPITFDPDLLRRLASYEWLGNVRELKNTLNYMLAVRSDECLSINDLPDDTFFKPMTLGREPIKSTTHKLLSKEMEMVLWLIEDRIYKDLCVTRKSLSIASEQTGYKRSENQIRRILGALRDEGYITLSKGRNGIALTEAGKRVLDQIRVELG